jgi:protein-L-isoaspartate(D-aspartate) O-methyltransferase
LPIGHGQTISQPYVVARMAELLRQGENLMHGGGRVLEVGTGCGYQAAVLARLFGEVYSVERIAALQTQARKATRELRLLNLRFKHADGMQGLAEAAPVRRHHRGGGRHAGATGPARSNSRSVVDW